VDLIFLVILRYAQKITGATEEKITLVFAILIGFILAVDPGIKIVYIILFKICQPSFLVVIVLQVSSCAKFSFCLVAA